MATIQINLTAGNDKIVSGGIYGAGANQITVSNSQAYLVYGDNNNDSINFSASRVSDSLYGGAGNDTITGSAVAGSLLTTGGGNDVLTGGNGNDTLTVDLAGSNRLIDGNGNDILTVNAAGNDTLTAGTGNDVFNISGGSMVKITAIGQAAGKYTFVTGNGTTTANKTDTLNVNAGATATAVIAPAGWAPTVLTVNNGTVFLLDAGHAVNLSNAAGSNGFTLTDTGSGATLTGSGQGDTINAGISDTIIAGNGANNINGNSGDKITGGSGSNVYVIKAGTETITDLGKGNDILSVLKGATLNAMINPGGWTAPAATINNGIANLTTAAYPLDLSKAGGSNGFTLTDTGKNNTLMGSGQGDVFNGGSGDTLTGGAGADTFNIKAGTEAITDLGNGADILKVTTGATVNAVISANGWVATAATVNSGTANLTTNGAAVDLSKATGAKGFSLTDSVGGATLTGSSHGDTLSGGGNDRIIAGNGSNILNGGNGDTLSGGTGADKFNVNAGKETITNLGSGADILLVSNSASVNATVSSGGWTATKASINAGFANLITNGYPLDLSKAGSGNGFTVTETGKNATVIGSNNGDSINVNSSGNDTITAGTGSNHFDVSGGGTTTFTHAISANDQLIIEPGAAVILNAGADWSSVTNNGAIDLTTTVTNVDLTTPPYSTVVGTGGWNITSKAVQGPVTLTSNGANDTLTGSVSVANTLIANGGNDVLSGGSKVDTFIINTGTGTITNLGNLSDILTVAAGATANATINAAGWKATAATINNGAVNLTTNGYLLDLSKAGGGNGFTITETGKNATLTGSNNGDSIFVKSGGNDTVTAGAGNNHFDVSGGGTTTFTHAITVNDKLVIESGSAAVLNAATHWASVSNSGTIDLTTADNNVDLTAAPYNTVAGSGGWNISSTAVQGSVTLTSNAANDTLTGSSGVTNTLIANGGNDVLTGGAKVDNFVINAGTATITNLGNLTDMLTVAAGATANATINAAGWQPAAASVNNGVVNLTTNGYLLDLSKAGGSKGFTITETGKNATLIGSNNGDSIFVKSSGSDTVTAGAGHNRFDVSGGGVTTFTHTITANDTLLIESGSAAVLNAGANWSSITNNGAIDLKTADARVDLNAAPYGTVAGTGGWNIISTATQGPVTLVSNASNDTLTGSATVANNLVANGGNDVLTGGSKVDAFIINAGTATITDLGNITDILTVASGATANATINSAGWQPTAATLNNGIASLTTAGYNIDLHNVVFGNGFKITDTGSGTLLTGTAAGNDTITAGANDTIKLGQGADSINAAAGDNFVIQSGLVNGFNLGHNTLYTVDSISGYVASDTIKYLTAASLTIGNVGSGNAVSIDANGNVSFSGALPASLASAVDEVIAGFTTGSLAVSGVPVNGELAFFSFGNAEYLFISSGSSTISLEDTLIQLVGVTTPVSSLVLSTVHGQGALTFVP